MIDAQTAISLGYPIGLGLAAVGSAFGLGKAVSAAMDAIGGLTLSDLSVHHQDAVRRTPLIAGSQEYNG